MEIKIKVLRKISSSASLIYKNFLKLIGEIITVKANTNPRFAILDPTTLPMARSGWPVNVDFTLTINSGAEVAKETTVILLQLGIEKFRSSATVLSSTNSTFNQ